MKHIVGEYDCKKCKKHHLGSGMAVEDFIVCYDCYNLYQEELEPYIKERVLSYFKGVSDVQAT